MKQRSRFLTVLGILMLMLALAACKPKDFTLRLHLKPGDTFHVTVTNNQKMNETLMGQQITLDQEITMGYTWHVTAVDEQGNATVTITYDRMAMKQTQNGQTTSYDSATDQQPPDFFKGMDALIGKSFELVISPEGKMVAINGLDEMFQQIAADAGMTDEEADAFTKGLSGAFGEDAMQSQLDAMFAYYPNHPLEVGSTWEGDVTTNVLVPLDMHNTYTVKSWEDDTAVIEVSSTFETSPDETQQNGDTFNIAYDLKGNQSGTMTVDIATGMLTASKLEQHMEGKLLLQAPNSDVNVDVPLTADSTFTIEVSR